MKIFITKILLCIVIFDIGLVSAQEYINKTISLSINDRDLRNNFLRSPPLFRPKIGVALSGGGLRGLAQIGVLKVFEEMQIPVDYIAGTSIGCIIGGLYSIGYTADEIAGFTKKINWKEIFTDSSNRLSRFLGEKDDFPKPFLRIRMDGFKAYIPPAISRGQKLSMILNELVLRGRFNPHNNFDEFKIPFRAVATDLKTGKKLIIDRGDLGQVMLGSSAVPPLFSPVEFEDKLLVDGGLVDNIPTDVVKEMGSDIVIAVNTVSPLRKKNQLKLPWDQADQMINIMQYPINQKSLKLADFVITPHLGNRLPYNIDSLEVVINKGKDEAYKIVKKIRKKIDNYNLESYSSKTCFCSGIIIRGNKFFSTKFIKRFIKIGKGSEFSEKDVVKDLRSLYKSGFFSSVKAKLTGNSKRVIVTYCVKENPEIKEVEISGNSVISDSVIFAGLNFNLPSILNIEKLKSEFHSILKLYRSKNYSLADIKSVRYDSLKKRLTIVINEGRIDKITIVGNKRTKDFVILRDFPLNEGDVFNLTKAKEGIINIFSTGLFDRAFLSFPFRNPGSRVQINLEEKKFLILKFGGRYDYDNKTSGFFEIQDDNLFGINAKTSFIFLYGSRHKLYQYRLRQDRVSTTLLTFRLNLHYKDDLYYLRYSGFDVGNYLDRRIGGSFSFGQQLYKFGTISAEARIEKVKITPFTYPQFHHINRIIEENIDLRTITIRSIVDTQDKSPFPEKGKLHHLYYETAGKLLGGNLSYIKIFSSFESYYTFKGIHTIHPRIAAGVADETLPFSQRFKIGGDKTLFGYRENELIGRAFLSGSVEYRIKNRIFKYFDTYLSIRYDTGGVWAKNQSIHLGNMIHSWGATLAFNLPFGPIEFSYGRASTGKDRFYFSLGYRY
ncbi:hypothetical protein DRQ09_05850 [candidate division KSB1 bacterium]|nr:MAG: hypothetical protein DRQ09_05850 [candidate division KSB1 bacterium]